MGQEDKLQRSYEDLQKDIIEAIRSGKPIMGKGGVITPLIKGALEAALEGEITAHLEEESPEESNRRNGKLKKTMKSEMGRFELETPRDRESTFEPQIIKKRQTVLNESLDQRILNLFEAGMSYQDIQNHLEEMYEFKASSAQISAITDRLLPLIQEWRERPLQSVYAVIFLDAMFFKARIEGKVISRCVYTLLGINLEGKREPLGFYTPESEGAKFWLGILNDLQNRGVKDIYIACIDGLKGFPEAIQTIYPNTEIQLCVVHQIRQSFKYVATKDQKEFMQDLKLVYRASNKDLAEEHLLGLEDKWGKKYPMVIKSWQDKWAELSAFFKYGPEIRRLIYTTNPIEGMHRQIKKYTKSKAAFTSDNALFKAIFCAIKRLSEKWDKPIGH